LYRRLGGPQGRSGRLRKISPPPAFDPPTVQPVAKPTTLSRPTIREKCNANSYGRREPKEGHRYAAWRRAKLLAVAADGSLHVLVRATTIIYVHVPTCTCHYHHIPACLRNHWSLNNKITKTQQ
jgi:hypothetical protein